MTRMFRPVFAAWLFLAGIVLARFADEAMPGYYVLRPLLVAAVIAAILGAIAHWRLPRHAPLVALVASSLVALWSIWSPWGLLLLFVAAAVLLVRQIAIVRHRAPASMHPTVARLAIPFALVFFVIALGRALGVGLIELPGAQVPVDRQVSAPSFYVLLLDGYPRSDTLRREFGIDVSGFSDALTNRGFDVYDEATSDRIWTELTLLSLLNGTTDGVPEGSGFGADKRKIRQGLSDAVLPRDAQRAGYAFVVIDAPVGHVTFSAGNHIQHGGLNTYEERLLGESLLGPLIASVWPSLPTDSLREHLTESLESLVSLADPNARQLVFAHVLAPHPPFLWNAAGDPLPAPRYWPQVHLYEPVASKTGTSLSEYSKGMDAQIAALNTRLVATVDRLLQRDPGAVIVLFSDHGARHSEALMEIEWHRTFLAARTPGHPGIFRRQPSTTAILRELFRAYLIEGPSGATWLQSGG